ncbi:MAG TPA: hypothetical protein VGD15_18150 [Kribbella sp.]
MTHGGIELSWEHGIAAHRRSLHEATDPGELLGRWPAAAVAFTER